MTSKAITTFNQWQLRPLNWCVWQVHCPFFEWSCKETCWCVWWPQGAPVAPPPSVPGYGQWKRCQHIGLCANLIWHFLVAFNVLTTIAACHLPLYQCIAIVFRILLLSVRLIVPSVMQCYLVHWLNILSIAQHMMRVQRGVMFHIAWNLCGYNIMFSFKFLEQHCLMLSCRHLRKRNNVVIMF